MSDTLNVREFLRSEGFTVGDRGRFSAEMIARVNEKHPGVLDANGKVVKAAKAPAKPRTPRVTAPKPERDPNKPLAVERKVEVRQALPTLPVVRKQETLYALTPIGRSHAVVGYDQCFRCNNRVSVCPCLPGPKPPMGAIPVAGKPTA